MRSTSTLLSIIFLILSCMPCADMGVNDNIRTKFDLVSAEHHSHAAGSDLCSPFCVCSCCGSQLTEYPQFAMIDFSIAFKGIKKQLPSYQSILSSNFFGSIWQPPQLV